MYRCNAEKIAAALNLPLDTVFVSTAPDSKLSGNSVQHYHRLISSILSTAVKWQVIFSNPCERVDPPKIEKKEAHYLDETQAARLLEDLEHAPEQYRVMVALLLFTGLRRGELCGLEWDDIDWDEGLLSVRRSSLYLPKQGIFTDETKTATSQRVIKLPDDALTLLRQHRTEQAKQRLLVGDQWQDSHRLFTTWNGSPIHPDTFSKWFSGFVKEHDLPPVTAHSLRHTNATLLIIRDHLHYIDTLIERVDICINTMIDKYEGYIVLLRTIPGVDRSSAITILSEIGVDMTQFGSSKRLCCWAGLTPGNNESAGKKKSVRISRAGVYLKPALVQVAHAAVKDKLSPYYALKYERISKRRGKKRAIIAIARMILTAVFVMLSNLEEWNPVDLYRVDMPEHLKEKQLSKAVKQAIHFLKTQGLTVLDSA